MGAKQQKTEIFDKISTLKTTYELEKQGLNKRVDLLGNLESAKLKNKKDSFSFIIDILTVLVGQDVIRQGVIKVVSKVKVVENEFKKTIKHDLLANFNNSGTTLPSKVVNGFDIPISKIDPFNYLSISPLSEEGKLLLGKPNSTYNILSNIVQNNVQGLKPLNSFIDVSYNSANGMLKVIPKTNLPLKSFVENYIDNLSLIDEKTLLKQTLDLLFNLSSKSNRTSESLLLDEQLLSILEKISSNEEEDNYFKFDISNTLTENSRTRQSSTLITEVGCGTTSTTISISDVNNIIDGINKSFSSSVVEKTLNDISDNLVASNTNKNVNPSDIQSIRNNFFSKLIKYMKLTLMKGLIFNPEVQILFNMMDLIGNKNIQQVESPIEMIIRKKKIIKCIIENMIHNIVKILFSLLKKELLKLVSSVVLIYAKESIDKYKKILKSKVKPK